MKAWPLVGLLLCACRGPAVAGPPGEPIGITGTRPDAAPDRAAIFEASELPALLPKPLADDPLGVTVHRLSNGMTVYLATDRQEPSFYGWIAVRAGSRHDPADSTGLAHYLEHMLLFKGTDELGTRDHEAEAPHLERIRELYRELAKAPDEAARTTVLAEIDEHTQAVAKVAIPNEIGRLYTSLGMRRMNAFTNKDRTYYVQTVPANRLDAWATVEGERFADPVFRLFFPELEAVYEEKNRGLDSSWRWIWNLTGEGMFPEHPLGTQTTLGEIEHLKTPAFDAMNAFFEHWYVPNNMAIILVGDVDDSALPVLEKHFARLQPKPLPDAPPGDLTPIKGRVVKEVLAQEEELVRVAWRTVAAGHDDEPVLDVVQRLLEDDRSGLLYAELRQPKKVQWVNLTAATYREAGFLAVDAARRKNQTLPDVEGLIRGTVAKLADVTDAQVEAAKLHIAIDRKLEADFPNSTARRLLDTFVRKQQWADVVAAHTLVAGVSRADVVAAAKRYLGKDSVVVFRRQGTPKIPKVQKPTITPLQLDATKSSPLAERVAAMPAAPLTPRFTAEGTHYQERKTPAGLLIASGSERNDVFFVAYEFRRGTRRATLLCPALGIHRLSGTASLSPAQLQNELYALGSSIETRCGDVNTQVVVRGVDANLEPTLALLDAWFRAPKIEAGTLTQYVDARIERRKSELDSEDTLTSALRAFAHRNKNSSFLIRPSSAALRSLTPARVRREVTSLFDHEHRILYSGTRSIDDVASLLPRRAATKKTPAPPAVRYRRLKSTRIYVLHREQAKANVQITFGSAPHDPKDIVVHEVLSRYIGGGTGSITFREIRTKRSLAYAVGAGVGTGVLGDEVRYVGWMQNQNDKVAEAVPALLETMRRSAVEPGRFAEAKAAIQEQYRGSRVNPRFIAFEVDAWRTDGFETNPAPARYGALPDLDADDISTMLEHLATRPAIITIVGDETKIDLAALAELGTVQKVEAKQLFTP